LPNDELQWKGAKKIIEINPQSFEAQLSERLQALWRDDAVNAGEEEPSYLKNISSLVGQELHSFSLSKEKTLTHRDQKKLHALKLLLSALVYTDSARYTAWDAAWNAGAAGWDAGDAAWNAARNAAVNAAWAAVGEDPEATAWDAAWNAAWNAARGAALGAARGAASNAVKNVIRSQNESLSLLGKQGLTPKETGILAYRTAELVVSLKYLEKAKSIFEAVYDRTQEQLPPAESLTYLGSIEAWNAFKSKHFSAVERREDAFHFVKPVLDEITRIVTEIPQETSVCGEGKPQGRRCIIF
jgi:hypothetical protein